MSERERHKRVFLYHFSFAEFREARRGRDFVLRSSRCIQRSAEFREARRRRDISLSFSRCIKRPTRLTIRGL